MSKEVPQFPGPYDTNGREILILLSDGEWHNGSELMELCDQEPLENVIQRLKPSWRIEEEYQHGPGSLKSYRLSTSSIPLLMNLSVSCGGVK